MQTCGTLRQVSTHQRTRDWLPCSSAALQRVILKDYKQTKHARAAAKQCSDYQIINSFHYWPSLIEKQLRCLSSRYFTWSTSKCFNVGWHDQTEKSKVFMSWNQKNGVWRFSLICVSIKIMILCWKIFLNQLIDWDSIPSSSRYQTITELC